MTVNPPLSTPDPFSLSQTPDVSNIPTITPGSTPIIQSLPSATSAFNKKYSDPQLQSALTNLEPGLRNSLLQYDQTRVGRGQQPLSLQQTLAAIQSYQTKSPATPPESQGLFQRALGDVSSFVSEIPHIPFTLASEAQQLPEAPGKLSEVLGRGSPQNIIGGLEEVPGLRLVPGVYTASTLANEGPGGLLQHPVMSALDVLPYAHAPLSALAESAFSRIPRVAEARAALDLDATNAARTQAGLQPLAEPSAARLAVRTSPLYQTLTTTRPARAISAAFGATARDLSQIQQATIERAVTAANPDAPEWVLTPDTAQFRAMLSDARDWTTHIAPERMRDLTNRIQIDRNALFSDPTLTDHELAFAHSYVQHVDTAADYALRRQWMAQVDNEMMPPQQAARILNSRRQVAKFSTLNDVRNMVTQASGGESVLDQIDPTPILSEHLKPTDSIQLATGYMHAIDASGFDSSPIDAAIRAYKDGNASINDIANTIRQTVTTPVERPIVYADQMMDTLRPYTGGIGKGDPTIAQARGFLRAGDYQQALDRLRLLRDRSTHIIPGVDDMIDSATRMRDQAKWLKQTGNVNDRTVAAVTKSNAALEARYVPARFQPLIEQTLKDQLLDMYSSNPDAQGLIDQGFYSLVPGLKPIELARLQRDISATWKDMRDQGYDPAFVHRVSPSQLSAVERTSISDSIRTPSQVKTRTGDATPYVHDAAVALTDQAMEYLSRIGQEEFASTIQSLYGRTPEDLINKYRDAATYLAQVDPRFDAAGHMESMLKRDFVEYDPNAMFARTQSKLKTLSGQDVTYIPRGVSDVLNQMFTPKGPNLFTSLTDPVMKLFRMSVLPLSPRWHVNNLFGNATLLMTETDPTVPFRYFSRARDLLKTGDYHAIPGMPPSGLGTVPSDIIKWNKEASITDKILAGHNYKAGVFLRKVMDQAQPAIDKASGIVNWSYKVNGMVDDMNRAMAFLYGQDKALTKGMTAEQAQQAGVALVRRVLPEWDRMTPFERTIMRSVFPFYSWAQFITKHAYQFPMDHPYRVAVLGSLARNEIDDMGQALPSKFMDSIFLGHPDSMGNVTALQTGAMNPFRDVANYFTLAGFTRSLNPVVTTVLESLGLNPAQGSQDLYPDISYDPVTGQLRPSNPNLLSSFIGNVLPQSQIVMAMLGRNEQFKQVLRTNPDAAATMLRSSVGLPNLFKSVNVPQEVTKAEVQRETLQQQVQNDALRTGDWSRAQQFPQLQAYFQQVATLMGKSPELFKPYVPSGQQPSLSETLVQAGRGLGP